MVVVVAAVVVVVGGVILALHGEDGPSDVFGRVLGKHALPFVA